MSHAHNKGESAASSAAKAEHLFKKRHSLAHLLAMAVQEFDPEVKMAIGPVIDDGFYYDFEFSKGKIPNPDDLKQFEKRIRHLIKQNISFVRKDIDLATAQVEFADQPYKMELIKEIADKGESMTVYESGPFTDLCAGPHVDNTKEIDGDAFTISHIAGAYWRGDEHKPMLTRIYGIAFDTKVELEAYKHQQEEAKKRDHKILGPALGIYTISPLVGAGLPLLKPNGAFIKRTLEDYLWELHKDAGYDRVWTPHIAKNALYETSGHAAKFGDELFRVKGKEDDFILKPMNCPHHMQIFADNQFSYRDMPVRYFEPATVYRDEKSGQLAGLTRVRAITQDDGHLFCRKEQIGAEAATIISIIKKFYTTMGMMDGYWVRLSLRGDDTSTYLGSDEVWETAEKALTDICISEQLPYTPAKNEAAFYGPKLDFMFKDAIGREWQLATIQCDFNLPERFDLFFINEKGEKERPVVLHRAISGSLERFMGVMIEHFAGKFPLWLSPIQVRVLAVRDSHAAYAREVYNTLRASGIRVEIDDTDEGLGKKVRKAKVDNIPYFVIIGDKEVEAKNITVEHRDLGKIGELSVAQFRADLIEKISKRLI